MLRLVDGGIPRMLPITPKGPSLREKINQKLVEAGCVIDCTAPQYLWDMFIDEIEELIEEEKYRV